MLALNLLSWSVVPLSLGGVAAATRDIGGLARAALMLGFALAIAGLIARLLA